MMRFLCVLAGVGILGAVAHVTIVSTGGYTDATAVITIALAVGVAFGAYVAGRSPLPIALCIGAALLAGEAYGFLATASWHMAHVEKSTAPIRDAEDRHQAAKEWLARLDRDERVQRAEAALAAAQNDARTKSTAKDCLKGCIATLGATVEAARAAVAEARASLQLEQQQARTALTTNPRPGAQNPLAARLGVEAWELDLIMAGLRSFACTLAAGGLLAFGAHAARRSAPPKAEAAPQPAKAPPKVVTMRSARVEAEEFAKERLRPGSGRLPLGEIRHAYRAWCKERAVEPLSDAQIGKALGSLFESVGLFRDGDAIVGLKLAS